MHQNEKLINDFYTGFQRRKAASMIACYHSDVEFSDPVFPGLRGQQAAAMWQMFCDIGDPDIEITFSQVQADDRSGQAHWEAKYKFSKTGRAVHNIIDARFLFQNNKIIKHQDSFDLWRWTQMALGVKGLLLGWTPMVQSAIRKEALKGLNKYMEKSKLITIAG